MSYVDVDTNDIREKSSIRGSVVKFHSYFRLVEVDGEVCVDVDDDADGDVELD